MMTAGQYGNSGAYFNNNVNTATASFLGLQTTSGFMPHRNVSVYSVQTMGGAPLSIQNRAVAPSAAIVGRVGLRLVAFPLVPGWNYDTPLT